MSQFVEGNMPKSPTIASRPNGQREGGNCIRSGQKKP
jgi:hypothetical protein